MGADCDIEFIIEKQCIYTLDLSLKEAAISLSLDPMMYINTVECDFDFVKVSEYVPSDHSDHPAKNRLWNPTNPLVYLSHCHLDFGLSLSTDSGQSVILGWTENKSRLWFDLSSAGVFQSIGHHRTLDLNEVFPIANRLIRCLPEAQAVRITGTNL